MASDLAVAVQPADQDMMTSSGNSPVTGEFPSQRPVTRWFCGFFDLHMKKRLSKQSWRHRPRYDVTVISNEEEILLDKKSYEKTVVRQEK